MGLRHLGQVGGGEFFGIAFAIWDQARALPNSLSSITTTDGAMMANLRRDVFQLSVRSRTSTNRNGPKSQAGAINDRYSIKSVGSTLRQPHPVCPVKQTFAQSVGTSQTCHATWWACWFPQRNIGD